MKRFHVSLSVKDLDQSVRFYSTLFGAEPTVLKNDYAKWMLDDPRVNFSMSARGRAPGVDHLGIQVENSDELREVYGRMQTAQAPVLEVGETVCCYTRSEKSWVAAPEGVLWEAFLTTGEATVYGHDSELPLRDQESKTLDSGPCCGDSSAEPAAAPSGGLVPGPGDR